MACSQMAIGQRNQRYLVTSNATDAAGRTLSDITLDLLFVGALGATALQMGLLNTLGSLAFVVASIPAGHLVDKYSALKTLRIGLTGKLILMACLTLMAATGTLSIEMGMLLFALLGVCNVFSETAQTSAVPKLIGEDTTPRTTSISKLIARLNAADQTMVVVVPALAGTAFVLLGASSLLSIAAVLMLIALFLTLRIKVSRDIDFSLPDAQSSAQRTSIFAGMKYLLGNSGLRGTTLVVSLSNLGLAIGSSVEAIFIIKDLGFGELGFGIYASVAGVGGLIGAALSSRIAARYRAERLLLWTALAQVVLAAMTFGAAFTNEIFSVILLGAHALGWGSATLIFNIAASSWILDVVPEGLLGRVLSSRRLFTFGAIPLGSLVGGAVGSTWGTTAALAAWVGAALLAVICYLSLRGSLKR